MIGENFIEKKFSPLNSHEKNNSQIKTIHPVVDLRITYDTVVSAQNRLPCGTWTNTA